jgi:hypothetical protein
MTAPDRMPEAFENSLHDAGHPHMEPPANPGRFIYLKRPFEPAPAHGLERSSPRGGQASNLVTWRTTQDPESAGMLTFVAVISTELASLQSAPSVFGKRQRR